MPVERRSEAKKKVGRLERMLVEGCRILWYNLRRSTTTRWSQSALSYPKRWRTIAQRHWSIDTVFGTIIAGVQVKVTFEPFHSGQYAGHMFLGSWIWLENFSMSCKWSTSSRLVERIQESRWVQRSICESETKISCIRVDSAELQTLNSKLWTPDFEGF